jgi:hypothetical protein
MINSRTNWEYSVRLVERILDTIIVSSIFLKILSATTGNAVFITNFLQTDSLQLYAKNQFHSFCFLIVSFGPKERRWRLEIVNSS